MIQLIFWPFVAATLLCFFVKSKAAQWVNVILHIPWIYFLAKLIPLTPASGAFALSTTYATLPIFRSKLTFGADPLNVSLAALTVFLSVCLSFYFINHKKVNQSFLILFQFLNFATVASLFAADAFLFYIFWEFMLIPLLFLIGVWGSENRIYAALKFFSMTLAGSLGLLAGIIYISSHSAMGSLEWSEIAQKAPVLLKDAPWLMWAFLIAFLCQRC